MPLEVTALFNSLLSITPIQKLQNSWNGSDTNNTTSTLLQDIEIQCLLIQFFYTAHEKSTFIFPSDKN
jgi:hypothetical protein